MIPSLPRLSALFAAATVLATGLGTGTAAAQQSPDATPAATATPDPSSKKPVLSAAESDYLKRVAAENLGEMVVGLMAIEKGASDAVKKHGRELVDTHAKSMQALMELASRHNLFLPLEADRSAYTKLLEVGGADFDRLYAAEAQRLNQSAIDQLIAVLGQMTTSEVKNFAQDDLKDDQKHLTDAQNLAVKIATGK